MGQQNRAGYRTARSRGVADDPEEGRRACKSNSRSTATCHVAGLSPWPTIWLDSTNSGIESNALRPLHDNQRLRSHDHHSRTSLRNRPKPTRAGAYSDALGCGHWSSHLRVPGTAMARCKFCRGNDSCTSHVDVRSSGFAKDQSFKGPCAAPSIAGRIHASLEREDGLFGTRRLGLCFLSTERQAAAG